MLSEAQAFWDAIRGKVRDTARDVTKNAYRCERYEVTTAPDGTRMGVTLPMGTREIFLPYSREVESAAVGDQVLAVWWGSMSNAKVFYYADGYRGNSNIVKPLDAYPVGAIYLSTVSTSPATLFGGTWVQIEDTFLLAAGSTYTAGDTGGEATHTLTADEIPAHTHGSQSLTGYAQFRRVGSGAGNLFAGASGIVSNGGDGSSSYNVITGTGSSLASQKLNVDATHEHTSVGGGAAHNNLPPYLAVYVWKRTA